MPGLTIRVFGAPSVLYQDTVLSVDTRKAIALLVYLVIEAQPRTRDTLAALLWPEHDQGRSRAALRRTLSVLHKALDGRYLAIEREQVALDGRTGPWVDAVEFRRLLASRREHGHADKEVCVACLEPLHQAAELYRDDFLAGFSLRDSVAFDEWQFAQRQALSDELGVALAALTRCRILVGDLREAIVVGRRWLGLDPLNEQAHRILMRLYGWTGQQTAVIRQYDECVRTLERELGAAPLDATTRLYEAIRAHRAPGPPDAVERLGGAHAVASLVAPVAAETALPAAPFAPPPAQPLIGRDAEWAALLRCYASCERVGRLVGIEGEAGIGKTRLVDELVEHARGQGAVVGIARCYEGEAGLAYSALAALLRSVAGSAPAARVRDVPEIWLTEASRLAPELTSIRAGLVTPGPLESPGAQTRFFEGVRETLITLCRAGASPGLLVLDDAQWADEASLDALTYLARRIERQPLVLAVTWRSGSVDAQYRLRGLLAELQRSGRGFYLPLRRLDADDVEVWLRYGLGAAYAQRAPDLAGRLYQETEGLPFFISEYVMALSTGAVAGEADAWTAPVGVHDLLRSRLRSLSETAWQILTGAAVLGRSFDFDLVREVSGRSEEEVADALDELTRRGLIQEAPDTRLGDIAYDFTHDKLRSLVYDETSLARRRLLHRRAATELLESSRRQRQSAERAAQIAHHYEAAGHDAAAASQHAIAGERARELYAHSDAIRHFQRALALGYPQAAELHEAIGDAYTLLGDYTRALERYAAIAAASHVGALARLEHKIGEVHGRRGEWEEAQAHFEAAVDALRGATGQSVHDSTGEQARIYADLSLTVRRRGDIQQAWEYAERALALATAASDARALAQTHNILGALATSQGETARALRHLEESLSLAERLDDATTRAAALNNLALALQAAGEHERALPLAEAALALCVTQGDRHHEAALHNNVADLLHATGHAEDAMAHLKQAVSIYAEIGVDKGAVQPGIWKLVDW